MIPKSKHTILKHLNRGNKSTVKLLLILLLVGPCAPLHAQKKLLPAVERALAKPVLAPSVAELSSRSNVQALNNLKNIFHPVSYAALKSPHGSFPASLSRAVFQVQKGPLAHSTASAFALEIDGRTWGVTAAHVLHNIELEPYMKIKNQYGKELSAPIAYWHSSPKHDVAIFEIPAELKPFIQILRPLPHRPQVQSMALALGFVKGNPLFLPTEEVLFSGPYRLFLRDQAHREMTGFCGSPVIVDGQVAGLHVGSTRTQSSKQTYWYSLLGNFFSQQPPSMHLAAPIETVISLTRQFTGNAPAARQLIKVLGHTVAPLAPNERIYTIEQLRNGKIEYTTYDHPFMDPEKLEQFFDLQEDDILRISVYVPQDRVTRAFYRIYEVNVSTGLVSQRSKKAAF